MAAPKLLIGLLLPMALTACQSLAGKDRNESAEKHPALAFAQGACGGCHAVEHPGLSPNPEAPPFAAIVNRPGLTRQTLTAWLRDAHNYPEEMDFDLDPPQVEALVDYLLTLEDENYRRIVG